ncbi:MAG: hypothetical protein ABJH10_13790 [Marinomonas sp.]
MPKFIFAYHGKPDIQSKEQGTEHMKKWKAWSQGLDDAIVDPGMPTNASMTVSKEGVAEGGGTNPLSGITVIQADTMEDAIEMAKGCPHLSGTGTIEIAQAMEMDM